MIENNVINNIDEEQFITDFFAVESEIDYYYDLSAYYSIEKASIESELISTNIAYMSTESLKDKFIFHSNRIKTMIKGFLNDIIRYILDLLGFGVTNKRILLFVSRRLKEAHKSMMDIYMSRLEKGYYDFSDKPIEIRDTFWTMYRPICILLYIAILLNMSTKDLRDDSQVNSSTNVDYNKYQFNIQDQVMVKRVEDFLIDLKTEITRALLIGGFLTNVEKFTMYKQSNLKDLGKRILILSKEDFRALLKGTTNDKFLPQRFMDDIDNLIKNVVTSSIRSDKSLLKVLPLNNNKTLDEIYSIDTIDNLRNIFEENKEKFEDILSEMKEQADETVEIDSNAMFSQRVIDFLSYAPELAEIGKDVDFKKSLDNMKKNIDKLNKDLNKFDQNVSDMLVEHFKVLDFLSIATTAYLTSKSMVNKLSALCNTLIDDGITEMKKVESILA